MELKLLLTLIRRYIWLLLLGLLLGAGGAFLASQYQQPVYQSSTRVMVVRPQESSVTAGVNLNDQELMQTYVTLITTRPVLQAASQQLGYSVSANQITARQSAGTRILEITVRASTPQRAASTANTLVQVLIQHNDQLQASRFASSEESLQAQIAQVETQMADARATIEASAVVDRQARQQTLEEERSLLEDEIFELQRQIAVLEQEVEALLPTSPAPGEPPPRLTTLEQSQLVDKRTELAQLRFSLRLSEQRYANLIFPQSDSPDAQSGAHQQEANLTLYQQLYGNLLSAYESVRLARLQNTPNVVQVEEAMPASSPIQPQPLRNTLLGGAVGLILMGALAFLLEYLDDTLKTPQEISAVLDIPVIGFVADTPRKDEETGAIVAQEPRSPTAEAFRTLRTNLEFAAVDRPLRTILITSADPADGKTTIATNLAISLAQGGKRVFLIDADLRRPRIHRFLDLPNRVGLSDLFRNQATLKEAIQPYPDTKGVGVVTSGSLPPNPTELLASDRMTRILTEAETLADIVLIDSPPFIVSDPTILAARTDGILLVMRPGQTNVETARATLEQLRRADARIVGIVLNRVPRKRSHYYSGYRYYYAPYEAGHYSANGHSNNGHAPTPQPSTNPLRRLTRRLKP